MVTDHAPKTDQMHHQRASVVSALLEHQRFLISTHQNPDPDGLGSMLALGKSLKDSGREVFLLAPQPLEGPLREMTGADQVRMDLEKGMGVDVFLALDCADRSRLVHFEELRKVCQILINVDHHETNDFFGDLNWVNPKSSSSGELVFELIQEAGLPMDRDVATNLFAAIQADTGSFRYENTSPKALRIAALLMEAGARPWELAQTFLDRYNPARLKLLEMALGNIRFLYNGAVGMISLSKEMYKQAGAKEVDSERFVEFPRSVPGVELAVMIRELEQDHYKFSLRSNRRINVAKLAAGFGGGGHARAAGYDIRGSHAEVTRQFLHRIAAFFPLSAPGHGHQDSESAASMSRPSVPHDQGGTPQAGHEASH